MRKHGLKARLRKALVERVIQYSREVISVDYETEYELYLNQQGVMPPSYCECDTEEYK
jgi:hypothetical protein